VLAELEDKQRAAAKEYGPKMRAVRKCGFIGEPVGVVGARTFYGAARIGDLEVLILGHTNATNWTSQWRRVAQCCCIGEHLVGNMLEEGGVWFVTVIALNFDRAV
jgi:hypothetical protein